jgi:hypothetical protein
MKILVVIAFIAIVLSLGSALFYMMRGSPPPEEGQSPPKGNMATALAFRVGFSIVLFLCVATGVCMVRARAAVALLLCRACACKRCAAFSCSIACCACMLRSSPSKRAC